MKTVTVIPLKRVYLGDDLTYFTTKNVKKGDLVSITIRNKDTLGIVLSTSEVFKKKVEIKDMPFNLKKINEIKDHSIWRDEYLDSIIDCSNYFIATRNQAIFSLTPSVYKNNYHKLTKVKNQIDKNENRNSLNPKSEKLLFQASLENRVSYYKNLIRSSFALKKSIFITLPTNNDVEFFTELLKKGVENFTFSLNSSLSQKKLIEDYNEIISSSHPLLIIGTTPFLSIPRNDIGTIIVENENSSSYKMQFKPFIDLRIFAEIFASKIGAKFILADTFLRFESIAKRNTYSWEEVQPLCFRTDFKGALSIYDRRSKEKKFTIFSDESIEKIKSMVQNKKNVFVFSLRKGLATYTICKDCQEILLCDKCHSPVVLYTSKNGNKKMFVCNKCKDEKDPDMICKNCGSWNLLPLGIGTETAYKELRESFPKQKILILDKENTKTNKDAEKIIKEFEDGDGVILVATELALFYLRKKIPLSIIASFDSLWSIPNFRISDKIIDILISISSKTSEEMIIETRNKDDDGITAFKNETLLQYVRNELKLRENIEYPPFKRFIKVTFVGNKIQTEETRKMFSDKFDKYKPEIFSGFIPKLKNKYVTNMLLRIDIKNWSIPEIASHSFIDKDLSFLLLSLPPSFSINVDPLDIL
ncbi:MAG: hypothetical protein WCX79_02505 [Candidatus Paceibacterota bacterium]|jgi:primosomal protein N' (replication factor Y)